MIAPSPSTAQKALALSRNTPAAAIPILDLPHEAARRAASTGAPIYLPVNPVEYHGPHLPLHTDALISAGLIDDLHARLSAGHPGWPKLVATNLEIGVDPVPGPGSRPVPFRTVRALVIRACRALLELGAQRVVLMTFHGSPLHNHALEAGVRVLEKGGAQAFAPLNLVLQEMLTVDPMRYAPAFQHIEDAAEREAMIRELPLDFHGGFFETSVLLHYRPDAVLGHRQVSPCPLVQPRAVVRSVAKLLATIGAKAFSKEIDFAASALGWYGLRPFPGYTGRPHLATAAAGAFFAEQIVARYHEYAEDVFAGRARSPKPIMRWLDPIPSFG